ncbi:D-alanyl-D-alanine carboxypeptidase family protein [Actinoallomurus iriomotensis]|uniref:D-alanyl-D-alanine carboxypeptidase n=1 Tax=Actinoallomurus iriomotensis TaxID=478107 RepID=A0A9W6RX79_9ACTN|nr:serine hydrolase [Actinoallomurus iriomotensis]GLY81550.1 D-alanyl-D-alanine carboxypeptidase [Actinoallomurus iriomotensis]
MRLSARLIATGVVAGLLGVVPVAAEAASPAQSRLVARTTPAGPVTPAITTAASGPSGVSAKGAYLYDMDTAKKLWGVATTTKRPIGSITKMMTAVIALRAGGLDKTVTIKKSYVDHVKNNDASSAGLKAGDKVTVRQLLNAMLLPSGCDAAYALADIYGPGQTNFVAKMNKEAAALKMTSTHYLNADGLPTSTHKEGYSTPHDLILLARYAMTSTNFKAIVTRQSYSLSKTSGHAAYKWANTNLLLGSYSGAIGIKTGHTNAAGYSLVFAAQRNGRTLLGLVLNSTSTDSNRRFKDAAAMLDWGFGAKTTMRQLRSLPPGQATD